ncbi:MAG: phosphate ABC transporter ATP-binding protein [Leptolyngbya sp. PLA1]|nr:phosphate ABC transporter ATP-binding protein [Leptolyngbya sp. PLA1]
MARPPEQSRTPEVRAESLEPSLPGPGDPRPAKAECRNFSFFYGSFQAVKHVSLTFREKAVTALIGPSGCGKTTLLRCFNRMHDLYPNTRYQGGLILHSVGTDGQRRELDIVAPSTNPVEMRMRISMVFQKPNPFPKSIFENVAYGLRLRGISRRNDLRDRVEMALRGAALWDEVKDRLQGSAYGLSGGQQQRLCIARALAVEPEIVLFDEPTSALDPIATSKIEELIDSIRERVTIIIVTHNMQQASRVSDYTAFMYLGEMVEFDRTAKIFQNPAKPLTEQYISGRFG